MADYDLVKAVVAAIRAVPDISGPLKRNPDGTAAPSARIFGARVPANAAFPRAYVRRQQGPQWYRYPVADGGIDRTGRIALLIATTTTVTADPEDLIETLDEAAVAAVEAVTLPHLVNIWRVNAIPIYDQTDDLNTYLTGGSLYEYQRQY